MVRISTLVSLALLGGCDPGFVFRGRVVDASGKPIEDAEIALRCYATDQTSTRSDSQGRFHGHDIGAYGEACAIVIRSRVGKASSFPVMSYCTHRYYRDTCTEVTLNVTVP